MLFTTDFCGELSRDKPNGLRKPHLLGFDALNPSQWLLFAVGIEHLGSAGFRFSNFLLLPSFLQLTCDMRDSSAEGEG